jgi:phytanoyl-CoA hydroxylase
MTLMEKFTLTTTPEKVRTHFEKNGFAIFTKLDMASLARNFEDEIRYLIEVKRRKVDPKAKVTRETMFSKDLVQVHAKDRKDFVHILDAAHTLPGFYGLCASSLMRDMLKAIGYEHVSMTMTPRIRFDFPNEDEFLQPDHQDHYYNDGDQPFVTVWMPLLSVAPDMGALGVRPGSQVLGVLPRREIKERPYILLQDGPWQDKFPNVDLCLNYGEAIVFHMDLIHKSGLNRADRPRATLQLRYNNLADATYAAQGWPPSYKIISKKDQILKT